MFVTWSCIRIKGDGSERLSKNWLKSPTVSVLSPFHYCSCFCPSVCGFICCVCFVAVYFFFFFLFRCLGKAAAFSGLLHIQSNFNGSNTDGTLTMANTNSFLRPHKILPIAQEQIIREIFLFYHESVCCMYSESPSILPSYKSNN